MNAGTLRDLSIRLKGALWRQDQAARLATVEAWTVANLSRAKKIPKLQVLLRAHDRPRTPATSAPQPPALVREAVLLWASRVGLKVERHENPVI